MDQYEAYDRGNALRNRYTKVVDISEGLYGMVLVANDAVANRLVAVKFIYPVNYKKGVSLRPGSLPAVIAIKHDDGSSDGDGDGETGPLPLAVKRQLLEIAAKEIAIHNQLGNHVNITALYDHFDLFLVLEYCSRGDLYEAIQNGTGPALSYDIKEVFGQILNALEYCHSHLVYHRDLKPENILIAEDFLIKLCDWGLATTTRIITNRDEFDVGLERYMAPELFDEDIFEYDAGKIDLWSVGIILLTLVFHKNPFSAANYSDKRFIQFSSNREALFDFFSTMLGEMFAVLRYSLNIDPLNRDLELLREELDRLKYFTIDEEYWGDNDLEVEEVELFELDDDVFSPLTSPVKTDTTSKSISGPAKDVPPAIAISTAVDETEIPHNRRADALLSSLTNLKPIPIGGAKFVRNTRKPFTVALYNNQASMKTRYTRDFNREDFFTPKLVFSHYMDKYGEQQQQQQRRSRKYLRSQLGRGRQYWEKKRKARTWKKAKKRAPPHKLNHQNHGQGEHLDRTHNRRKLYLAAQGPRHPAPRTQPVPLPLSSSALGKYVPPFMRLPVDDKEHHHERPLLLAAEIDRLALGPDPSPEDDSVFHLDDEFDFDDLFDQTPPVAVTSNHRRQELDDCGKYIPPFRRGSIGGRIKPLRKELLSLVPFDSYWTRKDWSDYD